MYKVVYSNYNDRYLSVAAPGKACVLYDIGKWSQPPAWLNRLEFGLACFETLDDVVKWISNQGKNKPFGETRGGFSTPQVFEVDVEEKLPKHSVCRLYELGSGRLEESETMDWPDGTVFYRRVKLVKMVPYSEIETKFKEMYQ